VRNGADVPLPKDRETGRSAHTLVNVYREMLVHICREYPSLPDPRSLTMSEIRFFYEPLRESVLKPKPKQQPKPKRRGR
jgi:hypothetical protein